MQWAEVCREMIFTMYLKRVWIRKFIIIFGWLLVWQAISMLVGNEILLVGPLEAVGTLIGKLKEISFWQACLGSVLRISLGFLLGLAAGILLAVLSYRFQIMEEILSPVMTLMKAVPVASFVVLFLIWWSSAYLALVISFCITLPNLYVNTLAGMKNTDKKLLEMARVFKMAKKDSFFYIYRPAIKPFWDSAVAIAAGMSWKSGVAAEVIGQPDFAIGEQLYMSKIYLDTAGVLAWTVVVILLSMGFERLIKGLSNSFFAWQPSCKGIVKNGKSRATLELQHVSKKYYEQKILEEFSAEYCHGQSYTFSSPSGSGKTTLFRLIAGLENPDAGNIDGQGQSVSYLFQEDRLCEDYSAVKNVEMITGNEPEAKKALLCLLAEEDIHKPCKELSGGMKRRAAIVRAIVAQADILLLDEPYNGLDEANREKVAKYIADNTTDSIVLTATHIQ